MQIKFLKAKIKNFFRKKPAYVTITVLILMLVLVAITYLFADAIYSELAIARNNKGAQIAFSLAEAGVQEAIYKVKYKTEYTNFFLSNLSSNPSENIKSFTHSAPALINNGSYNVDIQKTAKGVAMITARGEFTMGLKKAHREIKLNIAQAYVAPPYDEDTAMFTDAQASATGDLDFKKSTINIYDGGLIAGRSLNLQHESVVTAEKSVKYVVSYSSQHSSVLKCECLFNDPDPLNPPPDCPSAPICTPQVIPVGEVKIPTIDFAAYRTKADSEHHVYSSAEFLNLIPLGQATTLEGTFFVEDPQLTISGNRNVTINGVLIVSSGNSGNINIGSNSGATTTLTINQLSGSGPAGIIAYGKIIIDEKSNFSGTGLLYSGEGVDMNSSSSPINLIGGILSRRITVGERTVNIHFNKDIINTTLANPNDTPIIELNHWEEEY